MTRARDLADSADKDISGTLTVDNIVMSNDMTVADDGKVIFGAGSDLQIFHDGSHSYISDQGTGHLKVFAESFFLNNAGDTEQMIGATVNGAVDLFHNGSKKLETSSTGITVTGNIANSSGDLTLDVAGDIILDADGGDIKFNDGGTHIGTLGNSSNDLFLFPIISNQDFKIFGNDGGSTITALTPDMSEAGAATFNAGATFGGNVGIGLSTMSSYYSDKFVINAGDEDGMTIVGGAGENNYIMFADGTSGSERYKGYIQYDHAYDYMILATNGSSRLTIDSAGRAGLGVIPAAVADSTGVSSLQLAGSFLTHFDIDGSGTTTLGNNLYFDGNANKALFYGSTSQYYQTGGIHHFRRSGVTGAGSTATMSEIVRFDGDGLKFNGDTSADNALSDYEIGSWTPRIRDGVGNII